MDLLIGLSKILHQIKLNVLYKLIIIILKFIIKIFMIKYTNQNEIQKLQFKVINNDYYKNFKIILTNSSIFSI